MKNIILTSAAALVLAGGFAAAPAIADDAASTAMTAQMTINGTPVPEDELQAVKDRCEALQQENQESLTRENDDTAMSDEDEVDSTDEALTPTINLQGLTHKQCEDGGFYSDSAM